MNVIGVLFLTGALLIASLAIIWQLGKRPSENKVFRKIQMVLQKEQVDENIGRKGMNPVHFSEVQTKGHLETTRRMERTIYRK